jgi:transposase-like protein
MDASSNQIISGKYGVSENSERQLLMFFKPLIAKGLNPISCTVDGNPRAIKVIRQLWPEIIIQRCLVHVQRQGLMWCRRYPKTASARKLRDIFLHVTNIRTKKERGKFLELISEWELKYGRNIKIQPEKGRVFSDVKRARSMLMKALPDMFHYLDDSNISITTNGLESYFSRLKGHYRQHRGLSKKKLVSYFNWYLFFRTK